MTGNLKMMMKFRDLQVAEDVGKMAKLGWFDVEFTMYGCAYLEQGNMYYKVSPNAGDIYEFIESSGLKNIYPSNMYSVTQKCAVPSGMKETIEQEVKLELAKTLQNIYPKEFFELLNQLAEDVTVNTAKDFLWQQVDELEGLFETEKLRLFENLVNYIYSCKILEKEEYHKILAWLKEERKSMEEDFVCKDIFEKQMYGILYRENGQERYLENARKEYVYEKMHEKEQQGEFVTPIFSKEYWYNYTYRLPDVMQNFKKNLKEYYNKEYVENLECLRQRTYDKEKFLLILSEVRAKYGEKPAETLCRYGYRWGINKNL